MSDHDRGDAIAEPVYVRWVIERDLSQVLAIEAESYDAPWAEEDFRRRLRARNCICVVAEAADGAIAGFVVFLLHPDRLELVNLAVHPWHRRRGVGSQLLAKLKGKLVPHRRRHIDADVHEEMLAAQLFLRANGFRAVGVRRDAYDDGRDDIQFRYDAEGGDHART